MASLHDGPTAGAAGEASGNAGGVATGVAGSREGRSFGDCDIGYLPLKTRPGVGGRVLLS